MKHRWLAIAVSTFLFAVLVAGCKKSATPAPSNTKAPVSVTPDQFATTRVVFEKHCQSCHGEKGKGGPVKLEDGTRLKVPTLCEGHALHHPDSDFVKQITKGGDGMPAFKEKLMANEINDLVRFVRHEFQGGMTPPAEPMKPMKGMK